MHGNKLLEDQSLHVGTRRLWSKVLCVPGSSPGMTTWGNGPVWA